MWRFNFKNLPKQSSFTVNVSPFLTHKDANVLFTGIVGAHAIFILMWSHLHYKFKCLRKYFVFNPY